MPQSPAFASETGAKEHPPACSREAYSSDL